MFRKPRLPQGPALTRGQVTWVASLVVKREVDRHRTGPGTRVLRCSQWPHQGRFAVGEVVISKTRRWTGHNNFHRRGLRAAESRSEERRGVVRRQMGRWYAVCSTGSSVRMSLLWGSVCAPGVLGQLCLYVLELSVGFECACAHGSGCAALVCVFMLVVYATKCVCMLAQEGGGRGLACMHPRPSVSPHAPACGPYPCAVQTAPLGGVAGAGDFLSSPCGERLHRFERGHKGVVASGASRNLRPKHPITIVI